MSLPSAPMEGVTSLTAMKMAAVSLDRLPTEIWIKIASYCGQTLRKNVRLLTLSKRWYAVAFAAFAHELNLTDIDLYNHMNCGCTLKQALPRMAPYIHSFRFTQHLIQQSSFDQLWDNLSPLIHNDSDNDIEFGCTTTPCAKVIRTCQLEAWARKRFPEPREAIARKVDRRTCHLFRFISRLLTLSDIDIFMGYRQFTKCVSPGLTTILTTSDHLTSLRLCLDGHPAWTPESQTPDSQREPAHVCALVIEKIPTLKKLFIAMNNVCTDLLKAFTDGGELPIETLVIALVPSRSQDFQRYSDISIVRDGNEWSQGQALGFCHDLRAFASRNKDARQLLLAGIETYYIEFFEENNGVQGELLGEEESLDFHVFDAVSGLLHIKEFVEEDPAELCSQIWDFLDHTDSLQIGREGRFKTFWDQTMPETAYSGRRRFPGPRQEH